MVRCGHQPQPLLHCHPTAIHLIFVLFPLYSIRSLIVNSSYMVDNLLAETEHGRALREIRQLDTGFDEYSFLQEMRDEYVPALARAFFRLDMDFLRRNCRETALAQMKAVQAARDVEGLTHDGQVLSVSKVELLQARTLDSSDSGTLPVVVLSCQVQYIHCVRNKKVSPWTAVAVDRGCLATAWPCACGVPNNSLTWDHVTRDMSRTHYGADWAVHESVQQ